MGTLDSLYTELRRARARGGLPAADHEALLDLPAVRECAAQLGLQPSEAVRSVVSWAAAHSLTGVDILVVDAALNLKLLKDRDPRLVPELYGASLMTRRAALLANWRELQRTFDLQPTNPPSDTSLRSTIESHAFHSLASALSSLHEQPEWREHLWNLRSRSGQVSSTSADPRVLVIGAAVMDINFRVSQNPEPDTSVQADALTLLPGGKGLTQAVAAARLGMRTTIATVIGDDEFGQSIRRTLEEEGISTSFVGVVRGAHSQVTGVITYRNGTSVALGWKNETELQLSSTYLQMLSDPRIFDEFDYIFLTFEPPIDVLESVLRRLKERLAPGPKERLAPGPVVILTPAPPYSGRLVQPGLLSAVDYLVANQWEASELVRQQAEGPPGLHLEALAHPVRMLGVDTVCLIVNQNCYVWKGNETFTIPALPTPVHEIAGSRDAFCAALARQLHDAGGEFSVSLLNWPMAAMAVAAANSGTSISMPDLADVEHFVEELGLLRGTAMARPLKQ